MAHYQNHYGDATSRSTNEYGNSVNYYDERSGTAGYGGTGATGLHRTGISSSSSSSEDENGVRERRKKGMKEKIKEKIPGVGSHSSKAPHTSSTTTPGGSVSSEQRQDKKGFVDKIKEKLPGHN